MNDSVVSQLFAGWLAWVCDNLKRCGFGIELFLDVYVKGVGGFVTSTVASSVSPSHSFGATKRLLTSPVQDLSCGFEGSGLTGSRGAGDADPSVLHPARENPRTL